MNPVVQFLGLCFLFLITFYFLCFIVSFEKLVKKDVIKIEIVNQCKK